MADCPVLPKERLCDFVAPHGVRCGHRESRHGLTYIFGTSVCFDRCDGSVAWHEFVPPSALEGVRWGRVHPEEAGKEQ